MHRDDKKAKALLEKGSPGMEAFLAVSRSLASSADLSRVLQTTVEAVTMLVGLDSAAVYLLDGEQLVLQATVPPLPPDFPEAMRRAPLADHPRIEEAIRTGRPVHVPDRRRVELAPAEREIVAARNLSTLLYVPLVADDESLGAFIVGSVAEPVTLGDDEIHLSLTLGNLAALAVQHTRLFNESRHYALQLEQALLEQVRAEEERKSLRAQLAQAQKLESIGRLAGGVAHDFNNLLGVILGYTELALERTRPEDALHRDLQEILAAARRSADVTQQLLAFARKQTIRPRPLDLNEKVAGLLGMLRRLIGEDIELTWAPGADLAPVFLDPSQLDQILINLCVNARDAIAGVGEISIETAMVDRGEYVSLTVSDDGRGMDQQTLDTIFEPFFTTKEHGAGTGLGLATVYGIVQQNDGHIDVDSRPGAGSTFRVYLPRHEGGVRSEDSREEASAARASGETVLVVEDEASIGRLVSRQLAALGYTVLRADSPARALDVAEKHEDRLDLLLTDVIMPGMNGRDLAARLQDRRPGLAVLYMSGYPADAVAHRGLLDEGLHFLQKPFTRQELAAKVRAALADDPPTA